MTAAPAAAETCSQQRLALLRRAGWIATLGNLALAVVKIVAGVLSGSLAVISDGVDTATDVAMGILLLCAAPIAARPPDERYPFGRLRAEAVAAKLLALIIAVIGFHLAWAAVARVLAPEPPSMPGILALWVTIISILAKIALAFNQYALAKRTQSSMLRANAINMRNDVVTSLGVLLGLGLSFALNAPILDALTALVIAGWILKSAIDIYRQAARELMDGVEDPHIYERIAQLVLSVPGAENPHRLRVRQMAHRIALDMDVEVDGTLSVTAGHRIAHQVEDSIRRHIPEINDVVVHIEPTGSGDDHDVNYGVHPFKDQ
ncbi:MAG: cation transporter [Planctomycetota bacterium]|nr:MAG: cation transporter [Planctomycetota bacterium]